MKKHLAHYRKGDGNAALAQILAKFSPEKIGAQEPEKFFNFFEKK